MSEPTFSDDEAQRARRALRDASGLPDEEFPLPALVGMVSDEIEALRARGKDDAEIAGMIEKATGKEVPAEAIGRHYASPEEREAIKS